MKWKHSIPKLYAEAELYWKGIAYMLPILKESSQIDNLNSLLKKAQREDQLTPTQVEKGE